MFSSSVGVNSGKCVADPFVIILPSEPRNQILSNDNFLLSTTIIPVFTTDLTTTGVEFTWKQYGDNWYAYNDFWLVQSEAESYFL